jgi:predicted dehydrogenase
MKDKVRVAVVGTGWWATATHIPALRENPHADLVALCDANAERLDAAAHAYGIEVTYTDHRALLAAERPDAVIVATTHATHFVVAQDCLNAGAHVLVEKPMTLHAADAQALTELAAQRGLSLLVGYPWNYSPQAQRVRDVVTSGQLGVVQFVNCVFNSYNTDLIGGTGRSYPPSEYPVHGPGDVYSKKEHSGGGHGHLQITHAAGLLFCVTGLRIHSVQARMANHGLPLDLVDAMTVEFAGGALGVVGGTSNSFIPKLDLYIGCAAGSVDMDMRMGTVLIHFADGTHEEVGPYENTYLRFAPAANLIAAARGVEAPVPAGEVGWRAVELLDAAYRSAEADGRAVLLDELYGATQG